MVQMENDLIGALQAYIQFLQQKVGNCEIFMISRGMPTSQKDLDIGKAHRDNITRLGGIFSKPEIKTENGGSYVNNESVPVKFIRLENKHLLKDPSRFTDLWEVSKFLMTEGVPHGNQCALTEEGKKYLICADSYRDVDEENPQPGDYYVIFPDKKVVLYTPAEFEANFKLI